ncbi:hypothetical protein, partial [Brevibacterium casei]|uniref:hypothetical protein n=1 Tax=Brevibacterium casei TaxID=33889 RepID=UPI001C92FCF1
RHSLDCSPASPMLLRRLDIASDPNCSFDRAAPLSGARDRQFNRSVGVFSNWSRESRDERHVHIISSGKIGVINASINLDEASQSYHHRRQESNRKSTSEV